MWSDRKYVNYIVDIMVYLMSVNFMQYGQIFLPLICLVLFIDNRFKLKVKNLKVFALLCVFGLSVFIFAHDVGIFSTVGFFFPLAYYVGLNIKGKQENLVRLAYIISIGMLTHLLLDFIYELYLFDLDLSFLFGKVTHYDIWIYLRGKILDNDFQFSDSAMKTTVLSSYLVIPTSVLFYSVFHDGNGKFRKLFLCLYVIAFIYSIALARRTFIVIFIATLFCTLIYEFFFIKKNRFDTKKELLFFGCVFGFVGLLTLSYFLNLFNVKNIMDNLTIIKRLKEKGLYTDRLDILLESIKLYPKYLWGGRKVSDSTGLLIHDFYGDIYDFAGVIPFVLIIIYSVLIATNLIKIFRKNGIDKKYLLLIANIFLCSILLLLVEPAISSTSIVILCLIITASSIETLFT